MSFQKINYGIIGAGHIGNFHSQQIQNIKPSVHVVGIYDINFKQAQKIALQNNIVAFKNLTELLSLCDAVSIATPADTHTAIALQALEEKCHVFIEKPLATTIADCKQIIASAERNKALVQVGHIERFNPAFVIFNKSNQDIPQFIESKRLTPFTKRGIDTNVILDLMIHDIDLILYLVKSEIESILDLKVYVSCKINFDGISRLADHASGVFIKKLGEKGKHPRSVLAVVRLPQNAPVMIDLRCAIKLI